MSTPTQYSPLAQSLPALILGGAGFSNQCHPDPASLPIGDIVRRAFDQGMRCIDTSPYYEPSEQLFGEALSHPLITEHYARSDYVLMTKCGRIAAEHFDYSPAWIRQSVERSLARLRTPYLDVVFCHDIEAVTDDDTLAAMAELLQFVREGKVKYVGLSSYRIDVLVARARLVRDRLGAPVDIIQNWGQLTLQNHRLELQDGLPAFEQAGVRVVLSSSPLAIGLLREGGVPLGSLGDFHPAPPGLRRAAQELAEHVAARGSSLASLALRYSLWRAQVDSRPALRVCVVTGISTLAELDENVEAAGRLLRGDWRAPALDEAQIAADRPLWDDARERLGGWADWQFVVPPEGWSQELKRIVSRGT
jgi:D-arabinose 1-dehydrogenase